jgi:hypothetical protein
MGAIGLESTETAVHGFTVSFPSIRQRKLEYTDATNSLVFKAPDCAILRYFMPVNLRKLMVDKLG